MRESIITETVIKALKLASLTGDLSVQGFEQLTPGDQYASAL
jgi:hypothetical protein